MNYPVREGNQGRSLGGFHPSSQEKNYGKKNENLRIFSIFVVIRGLNLVNFFFYMLKW